MANFFRRRDWSKRAGKRSIGRSTALRTERLENRYALSASAVGEAFTVNDFFPGEQSLDGSTAAVASSPVNHIVVYEGRGAIDRAGVFGRIYGADGQPLGESFQVNSTIRGVQHSPAVAAATDGSFVVVWAGRGVADKDGIFLQRYNSQGERLGDEVTVNATLGGIQTSPSVAVGDNGVFIVSWSGAGTGDASGVFFRRFNSEGALASEVRANSTVADDQTDATITTLDGNGFVVGWQSRWQDTADWGVYTQRYNSVALRVGGETQLNSTVAASQTNLTLATDPLGGYVAAWQSLDQDGDNWGVIGRAFGVAGTATGDEVVLNSTGTVGQQIDPALAVAEDGQWVTAWSSRTPDGDGWTTVTRAFEGDGTANDATVVPDSAGGDFTPNSTAPGVAINDEEAWVVWSGTAGGGSDQAGVQAQTYTLTVDNDGPQVAPDLAPIADRTTEVGAEIEVTVTATDTNSRDTLTFFLDADDSPDGAVLEQIDNNTAIVRWTPAAGDDGSTVGFRVLVTDDGDPLLVDAEEFSVTVQDVALSLDLNGAAAGTTAERDFVVGDENVSGNTAVRSLITDVQIDGAPMLSGATLRLVSRPDGTSEALSAAIPSGSPISVSYEATTGVLTLSGVATSEQYQAVLRTVIYNNTADTPDGQREVQVEVTEEGGSTVTEVATVQIVNPDVAAFAQALAAADADFFGAGWCENCTRQKELFGDGQSFLPFTEVTDGDRTPLATAPSDVTAYPTWVFANGNRLEGYQTLAALSAASGVAIPELAENTAPFLAELPDATLLVGSPLHVPLDGFDVNGGDLTYTVTSDNADVTAEVLSGNRSARIDVEGYGDLVFELFEQRAPRATNNLIDLAEADFYDGSEFHRVVDGFVIQGGINADGTPSPEGNYDDQFDVDLQHNRDGLLSAAKSDDDTNNSQFFVTEGPTRNLDFNHTIFGILVEGESNREAISATQRVRELPNDDPRFDDGNITGDRPVFDVVMNDVEIFEDNENGVLFLKAADGATGSANITVTVTDQDGNTSQRTFRVDLQDDSVNNRPFLDDIGSQTGPADSPVVFQLGSTDAEGDPVEYFVRAAAQSLDTTDFTFEVSDTGEVTITPPAGFTGTVQAEASVHPDGQLSLDNDFQVIPVTFT